LLQKEKEKLNTFKLEQEQIIINLNLQIKEYQSSITIHNDKIKQFTQQIQQEQEQNNNKLNQQIKELESNLFVEKEKINN